MYKKITYIVIFLSLTVQLTGCGKERQKDVQRIVLEKDVREQNLKLKDIDPKITVEKVNLQLDDGEHFFPIFYYQDEVHGYVVSDNGMLSSTLKDDYPIGGYIKQYLYKIDKNNRLIKTSKEAFNHSLSHKLTSFKLGEQDKVFSVDYKREDKPKEIIELTGTIEELKKQSHNSNYYIGNISENDNYVIINEVTSDKRKEYLYDIKSKRLYEMKDEIDGWFHYVDALKSLVYMDRDLKFYKVKLKGKYFYLDEYIDLKKKDGMDKARRGEMINSDEILLFQERLVSNGGHRFYKTTSVSKFNFKTNQYNVLFEAPEEVNIYAEYIGNNVLVLEEFEEKVNSIIPIKRYFKEIEGNELNSLFEEGIENEGKIVYPHIEIISEDGREIFLVRNLSELESDGQKTKGYIYKRYKIQ